MAEDLVNSEHLVAGSAYLASLARLGFEPEGALWSIRPGDADSRELALFTRLVDEVGPLELHRVLFDAFDSGATPSDFDPWQVAFFGPGQLFYELLVEHGRLLDDGAVAFLMTEFGAVVARPGEAEMEDDEDTEVRFVRPEWVYRLPKTISGSQELGGWRRFEQAVGQAA